MAIGLQTLSKFGRDDGKQMLFGYDGDRCPVVEPNLGADPYRRTPKTPAG